VFFCSTFRLGTSRVSLNLNSLHEDAWGSAPLTSVCAREQGVKRQLFVYMM